jgi:hypothetical protein
MRACTDPFDIGKCLKAGDVLRHPQLYKSLNKSGSVVLYYTCVASAGCSGIDFAEAVRALRDCFEDGRDS